MGLELKKYKIGIVLLIFMSILLSGCISSSTTSDNTISEGTSIEEIDKGADDDDSQTIDEVGRENNSGEIDTGIYNQKEDEGIYNETTDTNETDEEIYNGTIDTNETEDVEEIVDNAHIESKEGNAIRLDIGKGLKIKLFAYNNQSNTIRSEGTLKAILYEKIEDSDEGPKKGKELDGWTLQIKESDYGQNNELIKVLEYNNENITSTSGFGYMDYTFTTIDGKIFETSDEYINLVE